MLTSNGVPLVSVRGENNFSKSLAVSSSFDSSSSSEVPMVNLVTFCSLLLFVNLDLQKTKTDKNHILLHLT